MRWWCVLVLAGSGCQSLLGIDGFETAAVDGGGDGDSNGGDGGAVDAPGCFGTLSQICFATPPTGEVVLTGPIDTQTDARCDVRPVEGRELCVIAGATITLPMGTTVAATGVRPLVLVATDTIAIAGTLDASSAYGGATGAGAGGTGCVAAPGVSNTNEGGGGGAGGSFGAAGGKGGDGKNANTGGVAGAAVAITSIRGGCAGGKGGDGSGGGGGVVGQGGGAIALLAGTQLDVLATGGVFAAGAGGGEGNWNDGSQNRGAGGGGGAGGLVVFEAPTIAMAGIVAANGGGGGGGGDCCSGFPGANGKTTNYTSPAAGGPNEGNNHGGPGGPGGAVAIAAGEGLSPGNSGGGGGGGGSVGVVWVKGAVTGTRFSPAPTAN